MLYILQHILLPSFRSLFIALVILKHQLFLPMCRNNYVTPVLFPYENFERNVRTVRRTFCQIGRAKKKRFAFHDESCGLPFTQPDDTGIRRLRRTRRRKRVAWGRPAEVAEWPFAVSISYRRRQEPLLPDEARWYAMCGGSLITQTAVLTAAHCRINLFERKRNVSMSCTEGRGKNYAAKGGKSFHFFVKNGRKFPLLSKFQARKPKCGLQVYAGWQARVRACEPASSSPSSMKSLNLVRPNHMWVRSKFEGGGSRFLLQGGG